MLRVSRILCDNILNDRECKITAFHRTIQEMLDLAGCP
jgi:hypothetical protein